HAPSAQTIMEIGCGTGTHAVALADLGYSVTGIDLSPGMLDSAAARVADLPPSIAAMLSFAEGDARTVRLGKKFDAVISLFHVMSYQTSNSDLAASFATAREHLEPGGVFVFDCWYGPAVLRQFPSANRKELADDATTVVRHATPAVHANENVVDVKYDVTVTDRLTGVSEKLAETHRMRYLFTPEIQLALETAGMTLVDARGWMAEDAPDFNSWGACFVGRG
ncbi:MAG: class I SAM-dependent methyltransferase, partial [Gemmatimonadaceae bacterium]